jgi:hypothetical protein
MYKHNTKITSFKYDKILTYTTEQAYDKMFTQHFHQNNHSGTECNYYRIHLHSGTTWDLVFSDNIQCCHHVLLNINNCVKMATFQLGKYKKTGSTELKGRGWLGTVTPFLDRKVLTFIAVWAGALSCKYMCSNLASHVSFSLRNVSVPLGSSCWQPLFHANQCFSTSTQYLPTARHYR